MKKAINRIRWKHQAIFHKFHETIAEKVVRGVFVGIDPNPVTVGSKTRYEFPQQISYIKSKLGTDCKKGHFQGSYRFPSLFFGGLRPESTPRKRLMQAKKVTKRSGLRIDLCDRVKLPLSKYKGNSQ